MNDMEHDFGFQSGFAPFSGGLPPGLFPANRSFELLGPAEGG
jgi:hypothetical protein